VLISNAWAQAGAPGGTDLMSMLPIVIMFVLLYFLMIRPQMKRAKEHKTMVEALQKGDEVVAAGGIVGRITKLNDSYVTLQVASGIEIQAQRPSVQLLLPKGTLKTME
jgi:preprotein translocase subunit YajC